MALESIRRIYRGIDTTLRGIDRRSAFAAAVVATGVTLSVVVAKSLGVDSPYWAGITAMAVALPALHGAFVKSVHRLIGTFVGAALGLLVVVATGDVKALFFPCLFAVVFGCLWAAQRSRTPYAWIIGCVTCVMVMLGGVLEPHNAVLIAIYRPTEVTIGVVCMLACHGLAVYFAGLDGPVPDAATELAPASPSQRFWNAVSPALAACLTFGLWLALDFPGGSQGVVSVCALALTGPLEKVHFKGAQRLAGCLVGACLGIAATLLAIDMRAVFVLVIFAVAWFFVMLNRGSADCSYFGLQAEVAFLLAFAELSRTALSSDPAVSRLAGIAIGVAVFFAMEWLLQVLRRSRPSRAGSL